MTPVTVILPTLNEEDNIGPLIRRIMNHLYPAEIIVADDGSTDGTIEEVRAVRNTYPAVRLIRNNPPLGLSLSLSKGIHEAKYQIVAWMDADLSHPPELLEKMYTLIERKKYDLVIGSWLTTGGRDKRKHFHERIRSLTVNTICQLLFGRNFTAYTSGFAMARKGIFKDFVFTTGYGEYFIDLCVYAMKNNLRYKELPFTCMSRENGYSKTGSSLSGLVQKSAGYARTILRNCR